MLYQLSYARASGNLPERGVSASDRTRFPEPGKAAGGRLVTGPPRRSALSFSGRTYIAIV